MNYTHYRIYVANHEHGTQGRRVRNIYPLHEAIADYTHLCRNISVPGLIVTVRVRQEPWMACLHLH
jgi:hypothetical protein